MSMRALTWLAWRRLRLDWALSAALIAASLLTSATLAAVPMYADAGRELALRAALETRPATTPDVQITAPGLPLDRLAYQAAAARMDAAAAEALGTAPHVALRTLSTDPLTVAGAEDTRPGPGEPSRVVVRFRSGLEERVRITSGQAAPPAAGATDTPIPVTMEAGAARRAGLAPGARLRVHAAAAQQAVGVVLVVSGLFEATDPTDPYWQLHPESLDAIAGSVLLFVPETTLLGALAAALPHATLEASSDYAMPAADLHAAGAAAAERGLRALPAALRFGDAPASVETPLLPLLAAFDRDALVTRATLLPFGLLAAVLAAGGAHATARRRERRREGETDLLRTRGASEGQLRALAAIEASLVAVVPVAAGPLLAAAAIAFLGRHDALRALTADTLLVTFPGKDGYALGACGAALAWMAALLAARRGAAAAGAGTRALLRVAVGTLGAWLLVRDEPLIVATAVQGAHVVRYALLFAPWLLLTAGCAALALVWPLPPGSLTRAPALVQWLIRAAAERADRITLALILCAVALAVLAGASTPTLARSASARAAYAAGAAARVIAAPGLSNPAFPAAGDVSTRVARGEARLSTLDGTGPVTVLGIESGTFEAVAGGAPLHALLEALGTNVSTAQEPRLPVDARQAGLWLQLPTLAGAVDVALLLRDGDGTVREVMLTRAEPDASIGTGWRFVWAALPEQAPPATGWALGGLLLRVEGSATGLAAIGPLLTAGTPPDTTEFARNGQFAQGRLVFDFASPDGWEPIQSVREEVTTDTLAARREDPAPGTQSATLLRWPATSAIAGPREHGLRPGDGAPLLVFASRAAALATRVGPGDAAWLHTGGRAVHVEVAGVIEDFPTLEPGSAFVVADLSRLLWNANAAPAAKTQRVNEAWYAAADVDALRATLVRTLPAGTSLSDSAEAQRRSAGEALDGVLWSGALTLLSWWGLAAAGIALLAVSAPRRGAPSEESTRDAAPPDAGPVETGLRPRANSAALLLGGGLAIAAGLLAGDALAHWLVALLAHDGRGAPLAPALALQMDWGPPTIAFAVLAAAIVVWPASGVLRWTAPRRPPPEPD